MSTTRPTIEHLLAELSPMRRPVAQLWAALGVKRRDFAALLSEHRDALAAAGVELHTAAAGQARQPRLYVEVEGRRVAALSLPVVAVEEAPAPLALSPRPSGTLAQAAQAADAAAGRSALARYRTGLSEQTLRAQDADLKRWVRYLAAVGVEPCDADAWSISASCWGAVSWGLVEGFIAWQEAEGYARATIARALSTVRRYAEQAARAGAISPDELVKIQTVETPRPGSKEGRNRDAQRATTRKGKKKAAHTPITPEQARKLRQQPNTPEGRRDALVMCLLLDHALRVSEVHDLTVSAIDLAAGQMTFYRRKINLVQTHDLTPATLRAARRYLKHDAPAIGQLIRTVIGRGSEELGGPISIDGLAQLVRRLGKAAGVENLSPHDCRHYCITQAAARGFDPLRLQEFGGWSSLAMVRRYVERAAIANAGMVLPDDDLAEDEEE